MSETPERKVFAPASGIEKKQDEANLETLVRRHPDVDPAKIGEVYSEVKEKLIREAQIRTHILPLAFNLTHKKLSEQKNQTQKPKEQE